MLVNEYELAIELSDGGEWICDVAEHNDNNERRYHIAVDPPLFRDGHSDPFPMEMRFDANGKPIFITDHPQTEHLEELEGLLVREIVEDSF